MAPDSGAIFPPWNVIQRLPQIDLGRAITA
jgi:hypothetical protein